MAKIEYPKYKIVTDPDSHKRQGFRFGDVVRRQYADASGAVYSLMIVLEAGTEMIAGKESHYFIGALIEGDEPQAGERLDFVRVTSLIDPQREGAIYLTASDSDSPYMDIIDGLGSEFSLSYPQQLVAPTTTPGKHNYIRTGGNYFSYDYKESEDEVSRIVRIVRQTPSHISLSGVRVILEEKMPNPEKLVICYRARASHRCEDMVVYFAYYTGDGMDYMDPVIVDTQWEYHVAVISVDWTGSKSKALNFNFQNNADNTGQWIEIADLNVIRLADLSSFGRATKGRTGRLTGVIDPVFGVLDGYGAYFQNLYATRNVNIAGTLTAGDENGFSSTFYVGKIHKNVIPNSMTIEFSGKQGTVSAADNPVGIGHVYDIGFGKTLIAQSREWSESRTGRRYCFSVWLQCDYQCAIKIFQNGHQFADFLISDGKKWMRHHGSFILSDTEGSDVTITFDSQYAGPKICAPQLEAGSHPSQYQPTDGTLSYVEDYGAWFSKGGIGGTIQNPLLKLNPDGSISSRDNSFVINPDGTGHFAGGRFRWTGSQITLQDVTIRWEDLSEEARENLKGEPGVDGSDGRNGQDVYSLEIMSSGGQVFRATEVSTTLHARLYCGADEITFIVPPECYRWTRSSDNATQDETWNSLAVQGYSIEITQVDVSGRAVFDCEVSFTDELLQVAALITDLRHDAQQITLGEVHSFSECIYSDNAASVTIVDAENIYNMTRLNLSDPQCVDMSPFSGKTVYLFAEPVSLENEARVIISFT